mmetsp:Transcript_71530/g.124220  ORF Transcript_71530/g.124220 Transcript_71530/m.124220 type:complete len:83 (+) Transcript_71530:268-516(+)
MVEVAHLSSRQMLRMLTGEEAVLTAMRDQWQRWQRLHVAPSLQPDFFPWYLHASLQVKGWPIDPSDGISSGSCSCENPAGLT